MNLFRKKKRKFYFSMEAVESLGPLYKAFKQNPTKEIGGLIFGSIEHNAVHIEAIALVYNKWKIMSTVSYEPEAVHLAEVLKEYHDKGFKLIGEWHSHPSGKLYPSNEDVRIITGKAKIMKEYLFMILVERNIGMWLYRKGNVESEKIM